MHNLSLTNTHISVPRCKYEKAFLSLLFNLKFCKFILCKFALTI